MGAGSLQLTRIKLDEVLNFAGGDVHLNGIVRFAEGIWVADGAAIVGRDVWHALGADSHLLHTAQFVLQTKTIIRTARHLRNIRGITVMYVCMYVCM